LVLVACQVQESGTEPHPGIGAEEQGTESARDPAATFDGWMVEVFSIAPRTVGPIALEVGPVRAAPASSARPWIQHEVQFHNEGNRPVRFEDTRTSVFLRGRALLAADEGCGYERFRRKPVRPGACRLYLDAFVVRPGLRARRTVTLFKDLRGMEPLAPGTYVWMKKIRFRIGGADGPVRTATIRLTYELAPAGG
jgi:hypothetical protein